MIIVWIIIVAFYLVLYLIFREKNLIVFRNTMQ